MRAQYLKIKQHVHQQIDDGMWVVGHKTPSENQLAQLFSVSRMTANRALRELTDEGVLTRIAGVGTFVVEQIPQAPLFEIKNIADEISSRGHQHRAQLHSLEALAANSRVALALNVSEGTTIFHSLIVHFENDLAVQLENRYVNPQLAPDYMQQPFDQITPNQYLSEVAPITEAEHIIEAILPDSQTQRLLGIDASQPCLLLHRRTWSGNALASTAELTHPGNRYRLGGHFIPDRRPSTAATQSTQSRQTAPLGGQHG